MLVITRGYITWSKIPRKTRLPWALVLRWCWSCSAVDLLEPSRCDCKRQLGKLWNTCSSVHDTSAHGLPMFFATSSHAKPQHVNVNKHDKGLTRILSGLLGVGVDVIRLWVKLVSRKRYPPSVMGLPPIPLRQCMREIKRLEFANAASLGSLNLHAPSRNLYETFGTTLINHSWSLSPAGWFRSTYRFGRLVATLPKFQAVHLGISKSSLRPTKTQNLIHNMVTVVSNSDQSVGFKSWINLLMDQFWARIYDPLVNVYITMENHHF